MGPGQHQRGVLVEVSGDGLRVPHDVLHLLAQKVVLPHGFPQRLDLLVDKAPVLQLVHGLSLHLGNPLPRVKPVFQPPAQRAPGLDVELVQQGVAPGIPQGRVGGVDVCHGQRQQVVEMGLVPHGGGELPDDAGVGDVLALGHLGHQQVVLHQPADQVGVPLVDAVPLAKEVRIHRA